MSSETTFTASQVYPRVIITYCTQCKWLLRAGYHAQELLSTFSTDLAEVSLRPATGGTYWVDVEVAENVNGEAASDGEAKACRSYRIWDRKAKDGFPETKILKRLVRDVIDPARGLGHVDREHGSGPVSAVASTSTGSSAKTAAVPETAAIIQDNTTTAMPSRTIEDDDATVVAEEVDEVNGAKGKDHCEDCA